LLTNETEKEGEKRILENATSKKSGTLPKKEKGEAVIREGRQKKSEQKKRRCVMWRRESPRCARIPSCDTGLIGKESPTTGKGGKPLLRGKKSTHKDWELGKTQISIKKRPEKNSLLRKRFKEGKKKKGLESLEKQSRTSPESQERGQGNRNRRGKKEKNCS